MTGESDSPLDSESRSKRRRSSNHVAAGGAGAEPSELAAFVFADRPMLACGFAGMLV